VATEPDPFPPVPKAIVTKVAQAVRGLPEAWVEEAGIVHQVKVRKRNFAQLFSARDPAGVVKTMLVVRADPDERQVLLGLGHPFFRPGSGADRVGIVLEDATDWTEIRELLTESYLILAPKKLAALVAIPETG
jgi:hypothetical protein